MALIDTKELYWAAGFLEGEGWFANYRDHPRVGANQVQLEPLERLQNLFGSSIRHEKSRNLNTWEMSGPHAIGLMMTVYPLMSSRRKGQIKKAIEQWKNRVYIRAYSYERTEAQRRRYARLREAA